MYSPSFSVRPFLTDLLGPKSVELARIPPFPLPAFGLIRGRRSPQFLFNPFDSPLFLSARVASPSSKHCHQSPSFSDVAEPPFRRPIRSARSDYHRCSFFRRQQTTDQRLLFPRARELLPFFAVLLRRRLFPFVFPLLEAAVNNALRHFPGRDHGFFPVFPWWRYVQLPPLA